MNGSRRQFVFGYGSLTARPGPAPTRELKERGFVADLAGLRRVWGVAMDNRRDLPGYKYYTDAGGARVWAYVGMAAARERLAEGRRTGTAVIDAGYVRTVEAGFGVLGETELATVRRSLASGDLPVIELTRHDLASW